MYQLLYTLAYAALLPLVLLFLYRPWLLLQREQRPGFGARWGEHYGWIRKPVPQGGIWVHAVSVGEVLAAVPLLKQLRARYPEEPLIVTTTTRTGADQVESAFGKDPQVCHVYAPLDLPWFVQGFLRKAKPKTAVVMETELWPNTLACCHSQKIPVILANARLSERSAKRYAKRPNFTRWLLSHLSAISAQTEDDAARFVELGVAAEKVQVCGSIKFDLRLPDNLAEQQQELQTLIGRSRPVWCAASTHPGEDEVVLDAHRQLLHKQPDALLILIPRHPERFGPMAELCEKQEFVTARRSAGQPAPQAQVLLGDSMGEMLAYCGISDVVLMAGSLLGDKGGHNMLEPAALARPVLSGPHTYNFTEISRMLIEAGGMRTVNSAEEIADELNNLLTDSELREQMGAAGQGVVAKSQGALQRLLEQLAPWLNPLAR